MKNIILFIVGTILLLLAGFYGFASSADYKKILTLSLIFDFLALTVLSVLTLTSRGATRTAAVILITIGVLIGSQAFYRICI